MINRNKVKELLLSGKTLLEVSEELGCTKARIGQIAKELRLSKEQFGIGFKVKERKSKYLQELKEKYGKDSWKQDALGSAKSICFIRKRQNSKKTKWEWDLSPNDIVWPKYCPILGIEIDYFAEKRQENSPSFDRIDPSKGYIKGNVEILSWRANRIKNDGTKEEHELIAKYMASRSS